MISSLSRIGRMVRVGARSSQEQRLVIMTVSLWFQGRRNWKKKSHQICLMSGESKGFQGGPRASEEALGLPGMSSWEDPIHGQQMMRI